MASNYRNVGYPAMMGSQECAIKHLLNDTVLDLSEANITLSALAVDLCVLLTFNTASFPW